jgi:transposase
MDKADERLLAYRTTGEYWGKERAVIVTYNPSTARKQNYTFDNKLEVLREELLAMRKKVREREPHWRDPERVKERYQRLCERLHVSSDFYSVETSTTRNNLSMSFTRNVYLVEKRRQSFGKNIIITDNTDWSTVDIVEANLDRWEIEDRFRLSKNEEFVSVNPLRHWTDSKIRCHLFTYVVALTYLRRIELRLARTGIQRSAEEVMEDMHNLHSVLFLNDGRSIPKRKLEVPTKTQAEVLTAFGYEIDSGGVLQPVVR